MANHVAALSRSCFFYMRQLRSVRHSLTSEAMLTLIQAFVSSRLDYCNSVLAAVSSLLLQKMQVIQNAAARFVTGARRCDHMTLVLRELHWLPVRQRIGYGLKLLSWCTSASRLGSIISGIILRTNIILPWSVSSAIRHIWPTQLSSHED